MSKLNVKAIFLSAVLGFASMTQAQDFNTLKSVVKYWVGTGSDSAALVVTFRGDGFSDSSYVWGVLFSDSLSGNQVLDLVADDDPNFDWAESDGFLDSVSYGNKAGKNGTDNFWWNTFSQTDTGWISNTGLSEIVKNRDVYGLSFTDSDPIDYSPNRLPALAIPAFNPHILTLSDWDDNDWRWFGEGNSKAILVVDFDPAAGGKSFAFGIKFDDSATGLSLLEKVAELDSAFRIDANSFLNDIIYHTDSGIGGSPNYWGTWSATNFGNWYSNSGISEVVKDGDFFGCSYTDFAPALRTSYPQVVEAPEDDNISVRFINTGIEINAYPNPFTNSFTISAEAEFSVSVFTTTGQQVFATNGNGSLELSADLWQSGVYFVAVSTKAGTSVLKVIKSQP